jgi:hypothetical protein
VHHRGCSAATSCRINEIAPFVAQAPLGRDISPPNGASARSLRVRRVPRVVMNEILGAAGVLKPYCSRINFISHN